MWKSRFSEEQLIRILKEHQAGITVADICRKHGIGDTILMLAFEIARVELQGRLAAQHQRKAHSKQDGRRRRDAEKGPMGVVIKAIGLVSSELKIGLVNFACNMRRFVYLQRKAAAA